MPSIPREREAWFLCLFAAQFLIWLALTATQAGWDNPIATAIDTGKTMASMVILSTATTVVVVEGVAMLAERYLQRRYREGKAEGEAKGKASGQADTNRAWEDWLERKAKAERNDEAFDEPSPSEKAKQSGQSA